MNQANKACNKAMEWLHFPRRTETYRLYHAFTYGCCPLNHRDKGTGKSWTILACNQRQSANKWYKNLFLAGWRALTAESISGAGQSPAALLRGWFQTHCPSPEAAAAPLPSAAANSETTKDRTTRLQAAQSS